MTRGSRFPIPRIEAWVNEGESIRMSERGRIIATLVLGQANETSENGPLKPDIMWRLRETWPGSKAPKFWPI
jgi:hypothetical protein